MKKISIYLFTLILTSAVFVACEKEDNDKLTFDINNVEIIISDAAVVKVSGGVSPYTAKPVDETVAKATVEGSNITIEGLKEGSTTVKITDKNGLEASVAVAVKKDPFEDEKGDATVRFKWDTYNKVEGSEDGAGVYTLTKDENKNVIFSWKDESEENSFVLVLKDPQDYIGGAAEEAIVRETQIEVGELTLTVNNEEAKHAVSSWRLVQSKPANEEEGTPDTYWIAFTANGKSGICVAPLSIIEE